MAKRKARSRSALRCWDGASPSLQESDICLLPEQHHDSAPSAAPKIVYNPKLIPLRSPRVVVLDAQRVTNSFAKQLMRREPQELIIVGDTQVFPHPDMWFGKVCAHHGSTVGPVSIAPWYAIAECLSTALEASVDCTRRILAANRQEQELTMTHLRGGAQVVHLQDPVWLWKRRQRTIVLALTTAGGKTIDTLHLDEEPNARLRTTFGLVKAKDVDIALVDTPRTFGASRPECTIVLPGVATSSTEAAAKRTSKVVIGVGRAPG